MKDVANEGSIASILYDPHKPFEEWARNKPRAPLGVAKDFTARIILTSILPPIFF